MTTAIHPGVRIGHVHLTVSNLERAERFYREALGFEVMQRYGRSAVFLSAGGYHHHIALNTWAGEGAPQPPPGRTGLYHFAILYPGRAELAAAFKRLFDSRHPNRWRVRPRRQRSDLSSRSRWQRHRTLVGSAASRTALRRRRTAHGFQTSRSR